MLSLFPFLKISSYLLLPILSGCIGSFLVHGDTSENNYGNLSSVPDRPPQQSQESFKDKNKKMEEKYDYQTKENLKIRSDHHLDI